MKKQIIAIWTVSLGFALYIGYWTANLIPQTESVSHNVRSNYKNADNKSTSLKNSLGNKKRIRVTTSSAQENPSMEIIFASLASQLTNGSVDNKTIELIKNLNNSEFIQLIDQQLNEPMHRGNLYLLFKHYAWEFPLDAAQYYENNTATKEIKSLLRSALLESWSRVNPEEAYQWYMEKEYIKSKPDMDVQNIFSGLAEQGDLESTFDKLKMLDEKFFGLAACGISMKLKENDEYIDFLTRATELDNNKINIQTVAFWMRKDIKAVTNWLALQPDSPQKNNLKSTVLNQWMYINPQQGAQWYLDNTDSPQDAINVIAREWGRKDPQAALGWLEAKERSTAGYNDALETIFRSSIYTNIDFAMENINKLPNKNYKMTISKTIYWALSRDSPKKAKEFFDNSPYKKYIKKYKYK